MVMSVGTTKTLHGTGHIKMPRLLYFPSSLTQAHLKPDPHSTTDALVVLPLAQRSLGSPIRGAHLPLATVWFCMTQSILGYVSSCCTFAKKQALVQLPMVEIGGSVQFRQLLAVAIWMFRKVTFGTDSLFPIRIKSAVCRSGTPV